MTRIPFILLSTSDGSPITGATPTVTISKDGAAFTSATNTPAEIGNGYYYVDLTTAETTVTNNVIIRATATGAQPTAVVWEPEATMPNVPTAADNATAVWGASSRTLTNLNIQSELTTYGAAKTSDLSGLATSQAVANIATTAGAIKAKTDNLPQSPAAVGSAMTLTSATVTSIKSGLATGDNIELALGALEMYGDTNWSTADVSGLSTFNASTDAVTLTDAYDAAKTASQLTTSDLSALATSADVTSAQTALTSLLNSVLSGLYHWQVNDTMLTVYNNAGTAIGAYTLTKDSDGNIIAVTPVVTPTEG